MRNQRFCSHGETLGLQVSRDLIHQLVPYVEGCRLLLSTDMALGSPLRFRHAHEEQEERRAAAMGGISRAELGSCNMA